MDLRPIRLTDVEGFSVGHAQDLAAATGCTVILCEEGAVAGVDVRGGAPGTRETDLLNPVNAVERIHAVLLAGGSAFGLDAAAGVMQYLEARRIGFDVKVTAVPIVCGAVLFDLMIGNHRIRPDKEMGYRACANSTNRECPEGNIGAGTGATVGKLLGMGRAMKSGLGTAGLQSGDLKVGALVAVNCLGDVIDPRSGRILAGLLSEDLTTFSNTEEAMAKDYKSQENPFKSNTTIGVIVTNARLSKAQAGKLASMAHNGYARTIRPSHTMFDGDTIFALARGTVDADLSVVGMLSTNIMEEAVIRAVKKANSLCGLKCYADFIKQEQNNR